MDIECPKCCSDNVYDITGEYSSKDGKTSGAIAGTLLFPLLGTIIGAAIGEVMAGEDKDANGNTIIRYKCNACGKNFQLCPKCRKILKTEYFDTLPHREGYEIISGKKCRRCKNIIRNPEYKKIEENNT
ncbi:MAG: DUF456 domain-containing protein [Ruminococcus sp.]|nr:DUF456 domain-containing protein [Ruminococcus sp.]